MINYSAGRTSAPEDDGEFSNPWDTYDLKSFTSFLKFSLFSKDYTNLPDDEKVSQV